MNNESKFTVHIDASALEEPLARLQKVVEDVAERVGLVVDQLESGIAASHLGVPDSIHVIGMRGIMTDAVQQLRAVLGESAGPEAEMGCSQ